MLRFTKNISRLPTNLNEAFINCSLIKINKKIPNQKCRYNNTNQQHSAASNTQIYLKNLKNGSDIFLIGTAHVSKKSAEEVKEAIRWVKPDIIFVELCKKRAMKLMSKKSPTEDLSLINMFKTLWKSILKGPAGISSSFTEMLFKGFYKFIKIMGLEPGLEFKAAMEEGEKINARLVYGDKSQEEILKRVSESVSINDILKLMMPVISGKIGSESEEFEKANNFEESVEAIKNRATVREMLRYIDEISPELAKAIVHERDEYMVNNLLKLEGRIVAVVGLGHLDGIERIWKEKQLNDDNEIINSS